MRSCGLAWVCEAEVVGVVVCSCVRVGCKCARAFMCVLWAGGRGAVEVARRERACARTSAADERHGRAARIEEARARACAGDGEGEPPHTLHCDAALLQVRPHALRRRRWLEPIGSLELRILPDARGSGGRQPRAGAPLDEQKLGARAANVHREHAALAPRLRIQHGRRADRCASLRRGARVRGHAGALRVVADGGVVAGGRVIAAAARTCAAVPRPPSHVSATRAAQALAQQHAHRGRVELRGGFEGGRREGHDGQEEAPAEDEPCDDVRLPPPCAPPAAFHGDAPVARSRRQRCL